MKESKPYSPPDKEPERQFYYIDKCKSLIKERSDRLGRPLYSFIQTFGCQMNEKDSEKLAGIMRQMGFLAAEKEDKADLLLYNTCTVRENADKRLYGRLGVCKAYKQDNKDMLIALCGCMMQEEHVVDKIKSSYPYVDIIFGTHNIYRFAELLYSRLETGSPVTDIRKEADRIVEELPSERRYSFKTGINIMYGCNNFCTYCIVPYVRGRERSREPKDIIREIERVAADGVSEIMLLGQNVNSYGRGLDSAISFAELLSEAAMVDGIRRVRFMTSHPKDLSPELIRVIAGNERIARHIHLPLQSGSDRILEAMNRHYTKERYIGLAKRIRQEIPDVSITSDIIVGFPGETVSDVEDTIDVIEQVRFDGAFTFEYSPRKGTPAANMEQLDKAFVQENFDRVLSTVQRISKEQAGRFEGRVMEVLIEGEDEKDPARYTGRISQNNVVHFPKAGFQVGDFVQVSLDECKGFYYNGKAVVPK
ncbi:MAG: tRNA (N6-isopentenyl adenosine(37)-C2)-methylthiotransferase MiaB [Lachnospiraceae bacterium]|nr:tRNA (N6-isopentenyl adenosine(37)-C2)-methylthiotransferase MiaB [Lachnospiraceae bacterium]